MWGMKLPTKAMRVINYNFYYPAQMEREESCKGCHFLNARDINGCFFEIEIDPITLKRPEEDCPLVPKGFIKIVEMK